MKLLPLRKRVLLYQERLWNVLYTPQYNPSYYLGAIGVVFFLLLLMTGIYLFIFYKLASPYKSIQYITEGQRYYGGIVRSIHRYAADGLIAVALLHLVREFINNRYRFYRSVAWISGVVILIILTIEGIVGYWMVWDEKGKSVAMTAAKILDYVPVFIEPPPMGFLSNEGVSKTLFFVLTFLHLALPILCLILLWLHVSRMSRPVVKPPRPLTIGIVSMLIGVSLIMPAVSASVADVERLSVRVPIDWFYLYPFVMFSKLPDWVFFTSFTGLFMLLVALPFIRRSGRNPVVIVNLENCGGCGQCARDCPYEATYLRKRTDGRPYESEAVVIPERCAGCGICIGACNFAAREFPHTTEAQIKEEITKVLSYMKSVGPKILGILCANSVRENELVGIPGVGTITLNCSGMTQPAMIEEAFRAGADGVFVSGCQPGDCHYREGNKWFLARWLGERYPILNMKTERARLRTYWGSAIEGKKLREEISRFQKELQGGGGSEGGGPGRSGGPGRTRPVWIPAFFALAVPLIFIAILSQKPHYSFYPEDAAILKLAFKYQGKPAVKCREVSEEERHEDFWKGQQAHMRRKGGIDCGRKKLPSYVELSIDGEKRFSNVYYPTGLQKDGSTYIYEEVPVKPGRHAIVITMKDIRPEDDREGKAEAEELGYLFEKDTDFEEGKVRVIGFDKEAANFYLQGSGDEGASLE